MGGDRKSLGSLGEAGIGGKDGVVLIEPEIRREILGVRYPRAGLAGFFGVCGMKGKSKSANFF